MSNTQKSEWQARPRIWIRVLILFAALIVGAAGIAWYQNVSLSYETLVFNQVTGPTISPLPSTNSTCSTANTSCPIQNVGAGSHWVTFCIVSGTVATFALELEGSNDNSVIPNNWVQVSTQATTPTGTAGCGVLEAAGYYQYLRLNLITLTGVSPKISAWYSGIGTSIPGGGIISGFKSSQPVTQVTGFMAGLTNLKSTQSAMCSGSTCTLYSISAYNPNAAPVFIFLSAIQGSPSGVTSSISYGIPANSARDITLGPGIITGVGGTNIACSTGVTGAGDPASGCVVSWVYKPNTVINTQVSGVGIVQATSTQNPN